MRRLQRSRQLGLVQRQRVLVSVLDQDLQQVLLFLDRRGQQLFLEHHVGLVNLLLVQQRVLVRLELVLVGLRQIVERRAEDVDVPLVRHGQRPHLRPQQLDLGRRRGLGILNGLTQLCAPRPVLFPEQYNLVVHLGFLHRRMPLQLFPHRLYLSRNHPSPPLCFGTQRRLSPPRRNRALNALLPLRLCLPTARTRIQRHLRRSSPHSLRHQRQIFLHSLHLLLLTIISITSFTALFSTAISIRTSQTVIVDEFAVGAQNGCKVVWVEHGRVVQVDGSRCGRGLARGRCGQRRHCVCSCGLTPGSSSGDLGCVGCLQIGHQVGQLVCLAGLDSVELDVHGKLELLAVGRLFGHAVDLGHESFDLLGMERLEGRDSGLCLLVVCGDGGATAERGRSPVPRVLQLAGQHFLLQRPPERVELSEPGRDHVDVVDLCLLRGETIVDALALDVGGQLEGGDVRLVADAEVADLGRVLGLEHGVGRVLGLELRAQIVDDGPSRVTLQHGRRPLEDRDGLGLGTVTSIACQRTPWLDGAGACGRACSGRQGGETEAEDVELLGV